MLKKLIRTLPLLCVLTTFYCPSQTALATGNLLLDAEDSQNEKNIKPQDVIHWQDNGAAAYPDGTVVVSVRLVTEKEFTLYTDKVSFSSPEAPTLDRISAPPTQKLVDPVSGKEVEVYASGDFELTFKADKPFTGELFPINIRYIGCTNRICLFPFTQTLHFKAHQVDAPAPTGPALMPMPESTAKALNLEETLVSYLQSKETSLALLLLILFIGGFLTNLTPCVYPMIPITIRLLGKQSRSPLLCSLAYALGIIFVYTTLGLFASLSGSVFGQYMGSRGFNLVLAALMVTLALTMIGYGDFTFFQNLGITIEKGRKKHGVRRAFLMGCGAGFVAAPCTGLILASLLGYIASGKSISMSVLFLLVYSTGFALPYLFLGRLSSYLVKAKVSPTTQNIIKLLFAAIMFALAFYYLRIPFYGTLQELGPVWGRIAAAALGLSFVLMVLVQLFRRWTDKIMLSLAAMLLGLCVFSYSQWKTLDPQQAEFAVVWIHDDEAAAFAAAKAHHAPILIDMWAEWCEACKKMDATTFADPAVMMEAKEQGWVLLRFDLTESNEKNDRIQKEYGIQSLPTVVIIPKTGNNGQEPQRITLNGYVSAARLLNEMRMSR